VLEKGDAHLLHSLRDLAHWRILNAGDINSHHVWRREAPELEQSVLIAASRKADKVSNDVSGGGLNGLIECHEPGR